MIRAVRSIGAAVMVTAALSFALPAAAAAQSALSVRDGAQWRRWWVESAAPARWDAPDATVSRAVEWRVAQPGVELGSVRFAGASLTSRFNVVLLRIDPRQVSLQLGSKRTASGRTLPWSTDDIPDTAVFAVNAGMFDGSGPWGWLVLDGAERQAPGIGPLSSAIVVDTSGAVRIVAAPAIAAVRAGGTARWAVQSYPTALVDGAIPPPLGAGGTGVDREHRDTRLAVGMLRDGRLLIALTRFDGLGDALGAIPLGPTLPEMTAIMGALGARDAVFLDGGLSAQMAVRHSDARVESWEGMRGVPLYLAGRPRPR